MVKRQVIPEWRPALELLAGSADGCTKELLFAHGFTDATIAGLVDTGLVAATTKRVLANQSPVDVTWFKITRCGRAALQTVPVPTVPNERGRLIAASAAGLSVADAGANRPSGPSAEASCNPPEKCP